MSAIMRFEEIKAWQTARELTNMVYNFTRQSQFSRDFGLKDQIQRASISVMSNIAEGFESPTQALFIKYLGHAKASAGEVRAQLYIALDQKYITQEEFDSAYALAEQTSRQLYGFIRYLEAQPNVRRVREDHTEYNI
ncbi:MAG: four helix bundle protein [Chloroflexi bacterium]|jgi:four helix bundle protein|nr:four helix bundle protein [Chloroflexota bacterium]